MRHLGFQPGGRKCVAVYTRKRPSIGSTEMQDADNKILENVVSTSGLDVHLADLKCAEGLNEKLSSSMFVSHCLFSVNSSLPRCVHKLTKLQSLWIARASLLLWSF